MELPYGRNRKPRAGRSGALWLSIYVFVRSNPAKHCRASDQLETQLVAMVVRNVDRVDARLPIAFKLFQAQLLGLWVLTQLLESLLDG